MTSSWLRRKEALQAIFHDGFWKSDHDFLIWRHHGFSARERFRRFFMTNSERATTTFWWRSIVTFYLGCMVSEIFPRFNCKADMTSSWFLRKGALHTGFVDGIWKSDPSFIIMVNWFISRISYRFGVIRHFILAGNCPLRPILGVFFSLKHLQISELHISHPKNGLPYTRPRLLSYCARKLVHGYGL